MNKEALVWHIGIILLIGGAISYFTETKWLAAAFWVSAAMYLNGSIAYVEDAQPGGFDNPEGTETADYAKGKAAAKFALTSLAVTVVLASIGF